MAQAILLFKFGGPCKPTYRTATVQCSTINEALAVASRFADDEALLRWGFVREPSPSAEGDFMDTVLGLK